MPITDDVLSLNEDTVVTIDVLANDSSTDSNSLTIVGFSQPANGTIFQNNDGTFTYTPNANFSGDDTFFYVAESSPGNGSSATVTITVSPVNDAPLASNDTVITNLDTPISLSAAQLLSNDSDAEGDPLVFVGFTQPSNGTISSNTDGTFTYIPNFGFTGADAFTYVISDSFGETSTAIVNISVGSEPNNGPSKIEGTPGDDTLIGTTGNDTIYGYEGNDVINSGLGQDFVDGGADNDVLVVDYSSLDYIYGSFDVGGSGFFYGYGPDGYHGVSFTNIERFNITGTANADNLYIGGLDSTLNGGGGDDSLYGGSGDDTLNGDAGNDRLYGNLGNNVINGGDGDDWIEGGTGDDLINAGDGNDTIWGGGGADTIDGGAGEDALVYADLSTETNDLTFTDGPITTSLKLANGTEITNIEFLDGLATGSGNDTISYSRHRNNIINTGAGNDTINAGLGEDTVDGGDGDDLLIVDYSSLDYIRSYSDDGVGANFYYSFGASGYSSVTFGNIERLHVIGTANDDIFSGGSGDDVLKAGAGNDVVSGGGGVDMIDGGDGEDGLGDANYSTETTDLTFDDAVLIKTPITFAHGTVATNFEFLDGLTTGSGNDKINYSRYRNNIIRTEAGNDTINAGLGQDIVDGGDGDDLLIVDYSSLSSLSSYGYGSYYGFGADGTSSISLTNIERLNMTATAGNDFFSGGIGNDVLQGGAGDDVVSGGGGSDMIDGGTGKDGLGDADFSHLTRGLTFTDSGDTYTRLNLANGTVATNFEFLDGLTTGSGNDKINYSRSRNNTIRTEAGNDTINAGLGQDIVDGGAGEDTLIIDYSSLDSLYSYTDSNGSGSYYGYGVDSYNYVSFSNIEQLHVIGTANSDYISGGSGADTLNDGAGSDTLIGGAGDDAIALAVDGFSDTITYTNGAGTETVKQFVRGVGGDVISFSGIAAIDVVKFGNSTQLRLSDGIAANTGFGKGTLLVTLVGTTGFTSADINVNLNSLDGAQFLFA